MNPLLDRKYLIALHLEDRIGWKTIASFIDVNIPLSSIKDREDKELQALTGLSIKVIHRIQHCLSQNSLDFIEERWFEKGIKIMTIFDQNYPVLLRKIADPPWVLYARGDISALELPMIAMVGTRNPTVYGLTVAERLAGQLTEYGWCIASGLARGIDSACHRGAIAAQGKTIAVLGCGLNHVYPKENVKLYQQIIEHGAILSEMNPDTKPHPGLFPLRNRIIAGLAHGTLVVEAAKKSGSLITADLAMNESREVLAVPGPITSPKSVGPLELIKQGAKLVASAEDVLIEFPWVEGLEANITVHRKLPELSIEEKELLASLTFEPVHLDQLANKGNFTLAQLHTLLVSLQMKKVIKQFPGYFYTRSPE